MSKKIEDMSFREAMEELNQVVSQLESNKLELEESLEKYKYGVELLTMLKERLNTASVSVEELMGQIEDNEG
ncbi:MAG: exodeoxyribonuclease VII small subunit [Coriobacteriia bacterium]|nr:exodeoxyribonuclease VII small subunit [Coriobacteriia bacterium]